jgi:hypothetical protein
MNSEICQGCVVEMCCTILCKDVREGLYNTIGSPICPFCEDENYLMRYVSSYYGHDTPKYNYLQCTNCGLEIYDE